MKSPRHKARLRAIALTSVILLTFIAAALIYPDSRQFIIKHLNPAAKAEHITVYQFQTSEDYNEVVLSLDLKLTNPSTTPRRLHSPHLILQTTGGKALPEFFLPNAQLPHSLVQLHQGESWSGELSWWLSPEQAQAPLELIWGDQTLPLPAANQQNHIERQVPPPPNAAPQQ